MGPLDVPVGLLDLRVEVEAVGELSLKGFQRPVKAFNVVRLKS